MTEYFFEEWSNDSFMDSGMAIPTYPKRLGILATALILQTYSDYEKGKIDKAALSEIERSIKDGKNRLE